MSEFEFVEFIPRRKVAAPRSNKWVELYNRLVEADRPAMKFSCETQRDAHNKASTIRHAVQKYRIDANVVVRDCDVYFVNNKWRRPQK